MIFKILQCTIQSLWKKEMNIFINDALLIKSAMQLKNV